jgi:general secretion pathway protein D
VKHFLTVLTFSLVVGCAREARQSEAPSLQVGLLGNAAAFLTSGRPERGDARTVAGPAERAVRGYTEFGSPGLPIATEGETPAERVTQVSSTGAGVTLNFVNVELQEFVRSVYDEVLHENVVIDPALSGRVTVRTSTPVTKGIAQRLVKEALQTAGASVHRTSDAWRVSAGSAAGRAREAIRVVPLRYINANDARQALQPFGTNGAAEVMAGGGGRFLIIGGRSAEVDTLEQVLINLDIDELQGRSFALLPLRQANSVAVSRDLGQMFGDAAQTVRILPVERMNAIMVVSRNPDAIERARGWVERLDQAGQDQRRVYVYPVRNRRAAEIAKVLDGMLQGKARIEGAQEALVAPGLTPIRTDIAVSGARGSFGTSPASDAGADFPREELNGSVIPRAQQVSKQTKDTGVEVRADTATNTLVVVSRPEDYRIVESAIRTLDVLPTQVLIEATIAEVRLNDTLRHGVRWFFQVGKHGFGLADSPFGRGESALPGFTYSFGVPSAKIAISALEAVTDVEIVSSPALTVLDNQTATLKVGDQVPIATRAARSITNPEAPIVNDIELKDTGVILQVTPRVNASGLVMLDIKQEASDVVPTTSSTIDSPTIRQRQVTSSVAVESGAEIILGGIITRRHARGKDGVPFLKDIPLLGAAFTSNGGYDNGRTELIIIIRPVVMANSADVRAVTDEIKARMRGVGSGGSYRF